MSCVESLLADLEQLLGGSADTDIVILCQNQEVRAHALILGAR